MPCYFEDPDLGKIILQVNVRAKRIIARKKGEQVYLTIPAHCTEFQVREAFDRLKPRIAKLKNYVRKPIDENFALKFFSFEVEISRNRLTQIYTNFRNGKLQISIPEQSDIYEEIIQDQIRRLIGIACRHEAKRLLPSMVEELAKRHNFRFAEVKINQSKSRWGSCSSRGSINLSYHCMLLPPHLLEFVILHELCHTREMNHSERFWAHLDNVSGQNAREFTQELKNIQTPIF
jgi:predicted metal-dependent hydrolase